MNGIASLFAWQQRQTPSFPEDRVPFYSSVEILGGMGKTSANTQEKNLLTLQLFLLAPLDMFYNNFLLKKY